MASAEPTLAGRPLAVSREASGTLDASQANGLTALPSIVLDGAAGPSVTVPDGPFLLLADYIREGADLVLVGPDGQTVVVRDYFASDAPPTLITASPTSHCRRSTEWIPWFISAPPPSSSQVPRQPPLS